jgi:hypothetical protein
VLTSVSRARIRFWSSFVLGTFQVNPSRHDSYCSFWSSFVLALHFAFSFVLHHTAHIHGGYVLRAHYFLSFVTLIEHFCYFHLFFYQHMFPIASSLNFCCFCWPAQLQVFRHEKETEESLCVDVGEHVGTCRLQMSMRRQYSRGSLQRGFSTGKVCLSGIQRYATIEWKGEMFNYTRPLLLICWYPSHRVTESPNISVINNKSRGSMASALDWLLVPCTSTRV